VALSGEEALNKVKGNAFDVLVTDWKMPEMDGLELARRIKRESPNTAVVMITGYPSLESSIEAIRSGITDYVPKPFTPEELSDAMLKALARGHAVPADLVLDRLVEKGIVAPKTKPEALKAMQVEAPVASTVVTPLTTKEEKVSRGRLTARAAVSPVLGRLFFLALGPMVIYAMVTGIFKVVFGKKPLQM